MPPRQAIRITDELLTAAGQLTGTDATSAFGGQDVYLLFEIVGPVEFNVKIVSEDQMAEEFTKDPDLKFMW